MNKKIRDKKLDWAEMSKVMELLLIDSRSSSDSWTRKLFEVVFMSVVIDYLDPEQLKIYIDSSEIGDFERSIDIISQIPDMDKKMKNRLYFQISKSMSNNDANGF